VFEYHFVCVFLGHAVRLTNLECLIFTSNIDPEHYNSNTSVRCTFYREQHPELQCRLHIKTSPELSSFHFVRTICCCITICNL